MEKPLKIDPHTFRQQEALAQYNKLRQRKTSIIILGRLCAYFLTGRIWRSQSEMALALGVSKPHVTRMLHAATIPDEVIHTFGDVYRISFAIAEKLVKLEKRTGRRRLRDSAAILGARPDLDVRTILAALATGLPVPTDRTVVRLTRHNEENYIRLYSPQLSRISSDVPRLEKAINAVLGAVLQLI
ncbi:hypothetical protein [Paraburkholderia hospita]|uniref:hypothetical protein n=1 Tax=Paraburkholderia hospita TaxID=169430 RepID=UPI001FC8BC37|nr:hypothetical protein [Paraburkholderia hospita]